MASMSRRMAITIPALFTMPALAAGTSCHGGNNPDADLIRLCAALLEATDTYNADNQGLEPEDDPLWQAILRIEEQLEGLEATTVAGLLALARVAQHEATMPDGSQNFDTAFTGDWPERIIRDLLAMAEGVQS